MWKKPKTIEVVDISADFGFKSKNPQDFIIGEESDRKTERRIIRILVNIEAVENINAKSTFTTKDGKRYFQIYNMGVNTENKDSVKKYAEILDFIFDNREYCPIDICFVSGLRVDLSDSLIGDTVTEIENDIIHLKYSDTLEEVNDFTYRKKFIDYAWEQCKQVDTDDTVDMEDFVCTLFIAFVCSSTIANFSLNYMHNNQCYTKNSPFDVVKRAKSLEGNVKFYHFHNVVKNALYGSIVDENRLEKVYELVGSKFHTLDFLGKRPYYPERVKDNIDAVCEFLDTYQEVTNIRFSKSTDKDFGHSFPDFIRLFFSLINKDNKTLMCKSVIFDGWLTSVNYPKDRYYSPSKSVAYYKKCKQDISYDRLALLYNEDFVNFADIVDGENSNVIYSSVFGKGWKEKGIFDSKEQYDEFLYGSKINCINVLFLIKKYNEFYNVGITEQEFIAMSRKFISTVVKFNERTLENSIFYTDTLGGIIKAFLSFLIRKIDNKKAILTFMDIFGELCEILEDTVDKEVSFGSHVDSIKVKDIVYLLELILEDVEGENVLSSKNIPFRMYVDIMK